MFADVSGDRRRSFCATGPEIPLGPGALEKTSTDTNTVQYPSFIHARALVAIQIIYLQFEILSVFPELSCPKPHLERH